VLKKKKTSKGRSTKKTAKRLTRQSRNLFRAKHCLLPKPCQEAATYRFSVRPAKSGDQVSCEIHKHISGGGKGVFKPIWVLTKDIISMKNDPRDRGFSSAAAPTKTIDGVRSNGGLRRRKSRDAILRLSTWRQYAALQYRTRHRTGNAWVRVDNPAAGATAGHAALAGSCRPAASPLVDWPTASIARQPGGDGRL